MDQEKIKQLITTLLVCLTIVGVIACITNGCTDYNARVYESQRDCVVNGGSWIPQYNRMALCIHGSDVKP
jgi:hypothetical protein